MKIINFIKKYPVFFFFLLTFIVSWGNILILAIVFSTGMPASSVQFDGLYNEFGPIIMLPFLLGPSIAGLIMNGITEGKKGFSNLFSRLLKFKIGIGWYGLALLMVPMVVISTLSLLSLTSSPFYPEIVTSNNKLIVLLTGLGLGISTIFEEIGWTGYVIPKLRKRYSSLVTGLIVGFLWGVWHILPTLWGSGNSNGLLSINLFIGPVTFYFLVLPIFRIIMVKAYDHSNSLLLATLMHGVLTACTVVIFSPKVRGFSLSGYYVILACVFLIVYFVIRYKLRKARPIRINSNINR